MHRSKFNLPAMQPNLIAFANLFAPAAHLYFGLKRRLGERKSETCNSITTTSTTNTIFNSLNDPAFLAGSFSFINTIVSHTNTNRFMKASLLKSKFLSVAIASLFFISAAFGQTGSQIFASGSGNFIVPAGVTKITVVVRGAGGGGGSNSTQSDGAGGGGGGGVARVIDYVVSPGQSIAYFVGTAGTAGTNGGNGGSGGQSYFGSSTLLFANGGTGGSGKTSGLNPGSGGAAGSAGGTITPTPSAFTGGAGAIGRDNPNGTGGGGGSSAGTGSVGDAGDAGGSNGGVGGTAPTGGFNGGAGGDGNTNGTVGSSPGGGGGGSGDDDGTAPIPSGGAGGAGQVEITWTCPTVTSISYATEICITTTSSSPIRVGTAGGTYSSTPGGLSIDPGTGIINASL